MSQALSIAIFEKVKGISRFNGNVHVGLASKDQAITTTSEYVVINRLPTPATDYNAGGDQIEQITFDFSVFGGNDNRVNGAIRELEKEFEASKPTLEEGTVMSAMKISDSLELEPEKSDKGLNVWRGILLYEFRIQRSLSA